MKDAELLKMLGVEQSEIQELTATLRRIVHEANQCSEVDSSEAVESFVYAALAPLGKELEEDIEVSHLVVPTNQSLLELQKIAIDTQDEDLACEVAIELSQRGEKGVDIKALQDVVCDGDIAPALYSFAKDVEHEDVDIERLYKTAMSGSGWPVELEDHDARDFARLYENAMAKKESEPNNSDSAAPGM
jgi:hypothetical protein